MSFQVVMAGIIAIYGVVVAVLIAGQLAPAGVGSDYTLYKWVYIQTSWRRYRLALECYYTST